MTARELERMMVQTFGKDFRDKTVAGWPLRDCFAECGLEDPAAPRDSGARGLWQMLPTPPRPPLDPVAQAYAALQATTRRRLRP